MRKADRNEEVACSPADAHGRTLPQARYMQTIVQHVGAQRLCEAACPKACPRRGDRDSGRREPRKQGGAHADGTEPGRLAQPALGPGLGPQTTGIGGARTESSAAAPRWREATARPQGKWRSEWCTSRTWQRCPPPPWPSCATRQADKHMAASAQSGVHGARQDGPLKGGARRNNVEQTNTLGIENVSHKYNHGEPDRKCPCVEHCPHGPNPLNNCLHGREVKPLASWRHFRTMAASDAGKGTPVSRRHMRALVAGTSVSGPRRTLPR